MATALLVLSSFLSSWENAHCNPVSKAETSKGQSSGKDQTEGVCNTYSVSVSLVSCAETASTAMEVDSAPRPASASFKKKSAGIRKQRRSKSTTTFKSLDRRRAKLAAARKKGKR